MSVDADAHWAPEVRGDGHSVRAAGGRLQLVVVEAGVQAAGRDVQVRIALEAAHPEDYLALVVQPQVAVVPGAYLALDDVQEHPLLGDLLLVRAAPRGQDLRGQEQQQGRRPGRGPPAGSGHGWRLSSGVCKWVSAAGDTGGAQYRSPSPSSARGATARPGAGSVAGTVPSHPREGPGRGGGLTLPPSAASTRGRGRAAMALSDSPPLPTRGRTLRIWTRGRSRPLLPPPFLASVVSRRLASQPPAAQTHE